MKIEILYFADCPNYAPAIDRLRTVIREEGLRDDFSRIEVKNAAAARRLRFLGSPTIRVNGLDVDPDSRSGSTPGFACRRYEEGAPSEEMIRAALREARRAENGRISHGDR